MNPPVLPGRHALDRIEAAVRSCRELERAQVSGVVRDLAPTHYRVAGLSPFVRLGDRVALLGSGEDAGGEVVRIDADAVTVKPFGTRIDARLGAAAIRVGPLRLHPDGSWKGRIMDALGRPLDGLGSLQRGADSVPVDRPAPSAMTRARVERPLKSGVRVIDLFAPLCAGQRIGIFAGSGVGKSTLLGMLGRSRGFDTVVIALVGERGREVRELLDGTLAAARPLTVTVVSTGDESPMMRRLAPKTAMTIAEHFRDQGQSVLLIIDSVTRYAHAARDVALAAGEPAVARGYPPSVFSELPALLERAGPGPVGSGAITAIFSVLVDGDDHNDPVADNIRGTLDGHLVLERAIADAGRFPAIDILGSISRLAAIVWTPEQRTLVRRLKAMIARFEDSRDLRLMGGYQAGGDPELDQAVAMVPKIYDTMAQSPEQPSCDDAFRDLANALQATR